MIRLARPADAPGISALLRAAFGGPAEAELVAALRRDSDAAIELVAEAGGTLAGHVLFSPMTVGDAAALALAPLAVLPAAQRRGIGSALAREGLARAALRREGWCLVLGDPAYYGRLGFAPAAHVSGVPWAGSPAFQALRLRADASALAGPARYARAFAVLPGEENAR